MPPSVALLNYISCGILWRIFCQTGIFAGFSLNTINFAVYLCASAHCVLNMHVCNTTNILNIRREEKEEEEQSTVEKNKKINQAWPLRKTPQNDGYVYIYH